ncbi:RadC family protein [Sporomusa acidovorans]|uniref:MPN domain-containing protein n=1 Tax=Sporomusa acidovorans (strain ATCC 49682 / DSM 3132 / Mol) TaxID=1123286 RepID=A0ABZ3J1J6_SPOA4|nr:DNA repair protein RadC [Sporomusa acidovorans]OZC22505.1 hypothetical protein SPACI_13430 [Sporomusa acidovorans DSM 3132]SDE73400.1 DNA repair protein RadC [Sporomusa acidovorans]
MTMDKQLMMKELPAAERPREKLLAKGAQALSNAELLAILLRTGTKNIPVNRLAEQLLAKYELAGLASISPPELSKTTGIGLVKAVTLVAGIELGRRLNQREPGQRPIIRSPQDAADLVMPELRYQTKEHFMALLLSTKNHVIARAIISVGSLNASIVHPRELFREAISYSAAAVILVHNHPSGDPTPSQEDISLTKQLVEAGNLLAIFVLDHVIIGDGKYVSFKEKGII